MTNANPTKPPTASPPVQATVNPACQPKKTTLSRFFKRKSYGERRSRAVAPAEAIGAAPARRRKAGGANDLARARDGSIVHLRAHHRLRLRVGEFMQKLYVELFFAIIALLYGVFVVIQIAMSEEDLAKYQNIIDVTDITVGSVLLVEIILKIFAFGLTYLRNGWSFFDAVVIILSFVLSIVAAASTEPLEGLVRILRLRVILRILRVLVVFERLKQRSRTMNFAHRGQMTSPLEIVLRMLNELRYHPALRSAIRQDVEFAIETIKNNRLYDANEELLTAGVDDVTQNWLRGQLMGVKDDAKVLPEDSGDEDQVAMETRGKHSIVSPPRHSLPNNATAAGDNTGVMHIKRSVTMKELLPTLDAAADYELQNLFRDAHKWVFDIFRVQTLTNGNAFCHLGYHLLHDLADTCLMVEQQVLVAFLLEIQQGYVSTNPYHNATHAADVMQTVYYFIMQPEMSPFLRPLDRALALISAGIHDFKHDGFNNSFHISTASEIALRYNDNAVLENYHVAQSFLVMKNPENNVLGGLSGEDFKYAREMIIQMVLATDMAKHFEDVALFKANILPPAGEDLTIKNVGDKKLLLKMVLHTCDVANPAKEREFMLKWTDRVVEEFFLQGDMEKQLQLPVSPFMDRDTIVLKKMQVGFADFIVTPLFSVWAQILDNVNAVAYPMLLSNREFWSSLTDDFKPHMIKDVAREVAQKKTTGIYSSIPEEKPSTPSLAAGRTRRSVTSLLMSTDDA